MKISKLFPAVCKKEEFSEAGRQFVLTCPGCYVLANGKDDVMYIGKATNLHGRMGSHLRNPEKRAKTPLGYVDWFYYRKCEESELSSIEVGWHNIFSLHEGGKLPYFGKADPPA